MHDAIPAVVRFLRTFAPIVCLTLVCAAAGAQSLSNVQLVTALRSGGYVLVMRHASSPSRAPSAGQSDRANLRHERQLDEQGRASARAMGKALQRLRVPIGKVFSSPTYRALETVRLADLGPPRTVAALGEAGRDAQVNSGGAQAQWLRTTVAQRPAPGTNTVIVTQAPNIRAAFPADTRELDEGEALIFRPAASSPPQLVGRVRIEDWPQLAAAATAPGG